MTHNGYLLIAIVLLSLVVLSGCSVKTTKVDTGCATIIVYSYCGSKVTFQF